MPITITDSQGNVRVERRGEVVEVRKRVVDRNHSDTLDYSDWRATEVTEALVYVGRYAPEGKLRYRSALPKHDQVYPRGCYRDGEELAPEDRFEWLDCTCLFRDRGQDLRVPRVDDIRHPDVVIGHVEYTEAWQRIDKECAEKAAADRLREEQALADRERNRPVVGKAMVVASGRRVQVGTVGTVAYVRADGRALLKRDHEWRDRKADGVWVEARHLRAR